MLISKEGSFGFVKYSTNEEAAKAIKAANGKIIGEKPIMVSNMHSEICCEVKFYAHKVFVTTL